MQKKSEKLIGIYGTGDFGRYLGRQMSVPFFYVDDTPSKQGVIIDDAKVLSLDDFAEKAATSPDYKLYIAIWRADFNFDIMQRVLAVIGLHCLSYPHFVWEQNPNAQIFFVEPRESLQQKMPRYQKLSSQLADEKSRRALEGHLAFRQSGDFSDLVIDENRFPDFIIEALTPEISYVDLGAYDGDTVCSFIGFCGNAYHRIHALEPDSHNADKLRARFSGGVRDKIRLVIIEAAIGAQRGRQCFSAIGTMSSALCQDGGIEVDVLQWEDIGARSPAYYKLDVEGAEPDIIRTAAVHIARERPLLAVSVYHAPDDLLEVFETLVMLDAGYQFYLRCHEKTGKELMLYARPNKP